MKTRTVITLILTLIASFIFSACSRQPTATTPRRYIKLSTTRPQAPFSDGVLHGNTLYLAGRLGLDPTTGKVPEDPKEEIKLILDGMKSTLAEAGMTMDDLVSVQIFCPEADKHYDLFNEVYRSYFTGQLPARAFLGSGVLLRGARFEVQGIAAKG